MKAVSTTTARYLTATVLAAALALTGCGRGSGDSADEAKSVGSGKAKGTITVWAMGTEGEKLGEFAKEFTKENPDATVKVTAVPWESAHDKISTAIAGGQTPDATLLGTTWVAEFAKSGALDPTPPDLISEDDFFPGAWDTTVVNDKSYGVPWYVETRLIFYRKDLAAKAGITSAPKSWDDLKNLATGLKSKGGAGHGLLLQPGQTGAWQTFIPLAWQNGVELIKDDKFNLDTPEMVEALTYYKSFFDGGLSPKAMPQSVEGDFVHGKLGAFVSGPWEMGIIAEQGGTGFDSKYDVAHMPTKKSGTSFVGGGDLTVFKDAKNRDGAWKFVQWLSKPETQIKWYQTVKDLPAVQGAWDDSTLKSDARLAAFGEQLKDAKSAPSIATWEQVATVIDGELEKVAKGTTSPAAAAKAMQSGASAIGTGA